MKRLFTSLALVLLFVQALPAQDAKLYFVDGFHGGYYGHYPLDSYTGYILDLLETRPGLAFGLEIEPETWDFVRDRAGDQYGRLKAMLADGRRLEYTNPTFAQPYLYNISGESMIRQFQYGIRKLREHFPDISFSTYAVEEPCFTSALPAVLKGFGFRYAVLKNPNTCWGGYMAPMEGELIRWTGPDGSSVITSPRHRFEGLSDDVWSTLANGADAGYYDQALQAGFKHPVGMCYQDAGWTRGPWLEWFPKHGKKLENILWTDYFERIATDVIPVDYRVKQDDIRVALVWGSQVLQRIARGVRQGENQLVQAEKMGSLAFLANGFRYDASVADDAWKNLLLSQHHDSWIVPYNTMNSRPEVPLADRRTWADWICETWIPATLRVSSALVAGAAFSFRDRSEKNTILVFNTLPIPRKEVVTLSVPDLPSDRRILLQDAEGKVVHCETLVCNGEKKMAFVAEVPAFGYASYTVATGDPGRWDSCEASDVRTVETDLYRLRFDPRHGGTIRSLTDKRTGLEVIRPDDRRFGELRGFFYEEGRYRSSAEMPATVRIIEDFGIQKTVRVSGSVAGHPFDMDYFLQDGDPRIEVSLKIRWQGNPGIGSYAQKDAYDNPKRSFYDEDGRLNLYFSVVADKSILYKNAPFDVAECRDGDTRFTDWREIKHNVILNWIDIGNPARGFAVLSDHTTAYACSPGKPLALTVQYAGNGLWGRDYTLDGPTEIGFSFFPHSGGWSCVEQESARWNEPLLVRTIRSGVRGRASFLDVGDSGYALSAACVTDEGLLIRFYNATGDGSTRTIRLPSSLGSAVETDLDGHPVGKEIRLDSTPDGQKTLQTAIPEFGLKTFILK